MATFTWPASLPQSPLLDGNEKSLPQLAIHTQMDSGAKKSRPRFTANTEPRTYSFLMTTAQKVTFETFWKNSIKGGAELFNWVDPEDGVTSKEWRIISPPNWSFLGVKWRVTISLELEP